MWRAILLGLVLVPAAVAQVGNDDGVLLGNEAAMSGGAVGAISSDATGAWYNPAALAGAERDSVDLSGIATTLRLADTPTLLRAAPRRDAGRCLVERARRAPLPRLHRHEPLPDRPLERSRSDRSRRVSPASFAPEVVAALRRSAPVATAVPPQRG